MQLQKKKKKVIIDISAVVTATNENAWSWHLPIEYGAREFPSKNELRQLEKHLIKHQR